MTAKTYRKKPVEIQAIQYNNSDILAGLIELGCPPMLGNALAPQTLATKGGRTDIGWWIDPATAVLMIRTLEGDLRATRGDWIIRGVQGEFYPCKPDIFTETYDEVGACDLDLTEDDEA